MGPPFCISTMIGLVTYLDYIKIILTATNIRIMEEIVENKLFRHIAEVPVCAQPVRPVQPTGQNSLHDLHGTMHVGQSIIPVAKTGQIGHHPEYKLPS